jgi:8-oxo-dGTP pyrophosphatase MutT (NUDIX family)
MTSDEQRLVSSVPFEDLWSRLWKWNNMSPRRRAECEHARIAHASLREVYDIEEMVRAAPTCRKEREWGFPKGRRSSVDTDIDTARREFVEKTGFGEDDVRILDDLIVDETFFGSNNVCYRHKYFIAEFTGDSAPREIEEGSAQATEIGAVRWFTLEEARAKVAEDRRTRLFDDIDRKVLPTLDRVIG